MASNEQATDNQSQPITDEPWVRLVDFCRQHGIGENRARRLIAGLSPEVAQKRVREQGGKSEWWVAADALTVLRGNQRQAIDEADDEVVQVVDKHSQATTADGWLAALDELRSERDRLVQELREEHAARREIGERAAAAQAVAGAAEGRLVEAARTIEELRSEVRLLEDKAESRGRQAEEAERARAAYAELLAEERAGWWQWCAVLKGMGMLRRLRGIPEPPEELAKGRKRLSPPVG